MRIGEWVGRAAVICGVLCGIVRAFAEPDAILGDLPGVQSYGQNTAAQKCAYAYGNTTCNIGTTAMRHISGTPFHPVIASAKYRYRVSAGSGRFEQVGISWAKWNFCAYQQTICDTCPEPACPGCCSALAAGCSDPYVATRNGVQSLLGPRSIINPWTGDHPASHPTPGTGVLPGRVQVRVGDLDPAQNPGAVYYAEYQVITPDEVTPANRMNNASHRRLGAPGAAPSFSFAFSGSTVRTLPAIFAWANHDPGVQFVNLDVDAVADGRFVLGAKATALGGNAWHYEYAIYNLNSDRAGQAFRVPVPGTVNVFNVGFRDVDYWAEAYSDADWTPTLADGALTWAAETYAQNVNANALRWGTLYNFRFDADAPPTTGLVTLTLFKPGTPASLGANVSVPCGPPAIEPPGALAAVCGMPYTSPPPAVAGTPPYAWTLVSGPAGMTINAATGQVEWPNPEASDVPYNMTVRAESVCGPGSDEATFPLTVARGDFTGDGKVTGADAAPFVERLLGVTASALCAADVNGDSVVDGRDIAPFVERLLNKETSP